MTDINIIYEDEDVLIVDKPAGIVVFNEGKNPSTGSGQFLIDELIKLNQELKNAGEAPRYGIAHRLDKDTSGLLLVAKSQKALIFLQKQFKNRGVEKKYLTLVTGHIKDDEGVIHTLIGRSPQDPRKQKAYPLEGAAKEGLREAKTSYKTLERLKEYTLLEVAIQTGRKHQIRCHLAHIHHPVAGDKKYGFKDSPIPEGLTRQFLHASYVKITLPDGSLQEFNSDLPEDLQKILNNLEKE
ncbi:MAG: RluA family pseudouridine synthase [bacterium]|nr:RluA family pseudouridine synthase [bacterium]